MNISRRLFSALLAQASLLALAGLSSAPASAQTADPALRGGVLNALWNSDPGVLVAIRPSNAGVYFIGPKINEGLVRLSLSQDEPPIPHLAESWEVSPDGRAVTLNLRRGVKWHDGAPFVARDVKVSLEILKQHHPRLAVVLRGLNAVETPDEHTVVLRLDEPVPYLLGALSAGEAPILPAHLYEGSDPLTNPANAAPVGTGPFKLGEWERGGHLILERNPDYWRAGLPYLDRIILRFVDDASARGVALETGEADVGIETPISRNEIERLRAAKAPLNFDTRPGDRVPFVTRLEFNLSNPNLADQRVRQAIAHAIDAQTILERAYLNQGEVATGPIPRGHAAFYDPDTQRYPFDKALAEKLLDEAGRPRGADGKRFKLRFFGYPAGADHRAAADLIQQYLTDVGIEVERRDGDIAAYVKAAYTDRDIDFSYHSMAQNIDPASGIQRLYWSQNFRPGVAFSNGSGYANPEVDRLLEQASVEPDESRRRELYSQFQKIVAAELPAVTLIETQKFDLVTTALQNYHIDGDGVKSTLAEAYLKR